MTRARLLPAIVALVIGLAASSSEALSQTPASTLKTGEHKEQGKYLTDGSGMSLYIFEEDRPEGDRGRSVESDCADDCLDRWPVFAGNIPQPVEGNADASQIGSFTRPDGKTQATYNGWPLYYFAEDFLPGDINGHDIDEFGGGWFLVTPAGHALGQDLRNDHRNRLKN